VEACECDGAAWLSEELCEGCAAPTVAPSGERVTDPVVAGETDGEKLDVVDCGEK
jgi:hypothetical protein